MPLSLHPVTHPSDIPTLASIYFAAFLTDPCYRAIWPAGATPPVLAYLEARYLHFFTSDPTVRFFKVVDTTSVSTTDPPTEGNGKGNIVAFSKWHLFPTPASAASRLDAGPRTWPPDCNVRCVDAFWSLLSASRQRQNTSLGAHVLLDICATHPEYMRRGCAGMMLARGTALADEMRLPCYLESSPVGIGVYRRAEFEVVGGFWFDYKAYAGEEGGEKEGREGKVEGEGEGWYREVFMIRPARSRGIDSGSLEQKN